MIQNICCTFVSEIEKSYPQKPVAEQVQVYEQFFGV